MVCAPREAEFTVVLGRCGPMSGLLLECVQHIHCIREAHRVDRAVRISIVIIHDFKNSGPAVSLKRLGCDVLAPVLSQ